VGPRREVGPPCATGVVKAARHRCGPRATPRQCGVGPIRSADRPRQPLWGKDRRGVAVVAGTRPGGRAGTPSSGVIAGRAGTPRNATRGLCGGRGSHSWKGRGPSAVDSTPLGAVPKYPHPGQQGNDLSRTWEDWIQTGGEGLFSCGFRSPPTTCLNFSLWNDLSVWRIWGGDFGRRRSGLEGVIDRGDAVPVAV